MIIEFCPTTHSFRVDGRRVPSVTQVLRDMGFITGVQWMTDYSRQRGIAVHKACEIIATGGTFAEPLDEAIVGRVEAFKAYRSHYPTVHVVAAEQFVYSMVNRVCGIRDLVLTDGVGRVVVDIKPPGPLKYSYLLQVAGYCEPDETWSGEILRVLDSGKYALDAIVTVRLLEFRKQFSTLCEAWWLKQERSGEPWPSTQAWDDANYEIREDV